MQLWYQSNSGTNIKHDIVDTKSRTICTVSWIYKGAFAGSYSSNSLEPKSFSVHSTAQTTVRYNLQKVAASGGYSAGCWEDSKGVGNKGSWVVGELHCHKLTKTEENLVGKAIISGETLERTWKTLVLLGHFVVALQSTYHSLTSWDLSCRDHVQPLLGLQISHSTTNLISTLLLNLSRDSDSTTVLGSLFQCLTLLSVKTFP